MTLLIMAAGMGSRFGGDKQTAHLGPSGEILMEYSVYDAIKAGFDRIIFVIRPGMESELQPLLSLLSSFIYFFPLSFFHMSKEVCSEKRNFFCQ